MALFRIRLDLPPPDRRGGAALADVLGQRRSAREFGAGGLTDREIGQMLWAAHGITDASRGLRAAPSAGALYPLEICVATDDGIHRYDAMRHALTRAGSEDARQRLARAALDQGWIAAAPCVFAIAAVASRTTRRYGERGHRYIHMEAGHAAQNLLLCATALGLAGVPVGAFDDAAVARVLALAPDETPLYLIPVGRA